MRHFLTLKDFSKDEILEMLDVILELKSQFLQKGNAPLYFKGKVLAMIFEKSSTRTRVSFETERNSLEDTAFFFHTKIYN